VGNAYFDLERKLVDFLGKPFRDEQDAIISTSRWPGIRCEFFVSLTGSELQILLLSSSRQGLGLASSAMCDLCQWADAERVRLALRPEPVNAYDPATLGWNGSHHSTLTSLRRALAAERRVTGCRTHRGGGASSRPRCGRETSSTSLVLMMRIR
jgi:hypothetical protein